MVRYCWAFSLAVTAITLRCRIRTGGIPKGFPELNLEVCPKAIFCLQQQAFLSPVAGSWHRIVTFSLPHRSPVEVQAALRFTISVGSIRKHNIHHGKISASIRSNGIEKKNKSGLLVSAKTTRLNILHRASTGLHGESGMLPNETCANQTYPLSTMHTTHPVKKFESLILAKANNIGTQLIDPATPLR